MSQTGPWSVKGIDQRAREAARDAAREQGMTLGEYLNRLLLEDAEAPVDDVAQPYQRDIPSPRAASKSLDSLTRRIEAAEARSTLAITGIDQSVLGLLARLERNEDNQAAMTAHIDSVIDDIQATHTAMASSVRKLESDESAQRNLDALKSLEDALGKLAAHVYVEGALAQDEAQAIKMRVETGLGDVTQRLDTMETKVDRTLTEAAQRVEKVVEQAELRTEGVGKHLSERFSALETDVARKLSIVDQVETRMGEVSGDVAGALDSMEDTLVRIQERLNRAENTTDTALKSLEATFDSLDRRIDDVARHASPEAAEALRSQFEARFEGLADEVRASVATARAELAQEIENAAQSANPDLMGRLETSVADVNARIDTLESSTSTTAETAVRNEFERLASTVGDRLEALESREASAVEQIGEDVSRTMERIQAQVDESEQRSAAAIEQVGEQVAIATGRLQARQDQALKVFDQKLEAQAQRAETRLSDALTNVSERLETMQEQTSASLSPVQRAITSLASRLESIEDFTAPPAAERPASEPIDVGPTLKPEAPMTVAEMLAQAAGAEDDYRGEPFPEPHTKPGEPTNPFDAVKSLIAAQQTEPFETSSETTSESAPQAADVFEDSDVFEEGVGALEAIENAPGSEPASPYADDFEGVHAATDETGLIDNFDADFIDEDGDFVSGPEAVQTEAQAVEAPEAPEAPEAEPLPEPEAEPKRYMTDLPDFDDEDAFLDLEDWSNAGSETRESDIFDDPDTVADVAPPIADVPPEVALETDFTEPAAISASENPDTGDYLARARRAAQAAASQTAVTEKPKRGRKPKAAKGTAKPLREESAGANRTPIYAAAGAIAVAAAGATVYLNHASDSAGDTDVIGDVPPSADPVQQANEPTVEELAAVLAETSDAAVISAALDGETLQERAGAVNDNSVGDDLFSEDPAVPNGAAASTVPTAEPPPVRLAAVSPNIARVPDAPALGAAAEAGDPIAQFILGEERLDAEDFAMGARLIRASAAQGQPAAQYRLAKLHEKGLGVPRDLSQARAWTQKAAEGGNVKAMHDLAVFYAQGDGGPQSYAAAVEWFRKASEYGVVDSQYNLGVLYEQGLGISPSLVEALVWFEIAERNGDPGAREKIVDLAGRVSADAARQARRRATEWTPATQPARANGTFAPQAWAVNDPSRVIAMQDALNHLGYPAGDADGQWGPSTARAAAAFRDAEGLPDGAGLDQALIDAVNTKLDAVRS